MCDPNTPYRVTPRLSVLRVEPELAGSRRRRLWELPHSCHCPVAGVCLPIEALRKLVNKALGGETLADDYALHVGVVSECGARSRVSEALQRELDRRCAIVIRRFAQAKSTEAVAALWAEAADAGDVAAALWAALAHPRCDAGLQENICRDIHMIQHQAGASVRADLHKLRALSEENGVLTRELARVQQRSTQWQAERTAEHERLNAQLIRLRAESIGKDTVIAAQAAELDALRRSTPEQSRSHLTRRVGELKQRVRALELELSQARRETTDAERDAAPTLVTQSSASADETAPADVPLQLDARSILCVGGRNGQIPIYRDLVERHGGRFTHHDGGIEDNPHRLDASLAAADLVICQTGCLSHNAYWLVKGHCKRTGKRCVYVDKPGIASFVRGLAQMAPVAAAADAASEPGSRGE